MVDRRQFLSAAVAGAVTLARNPMAFAAQASKYDLLIKGGRVIDPSVRLDAVRDVAIAGGRIAAVEPSITTAAAETIDARGKLVVPGLIDIHTHTGRTAESPGLVLRDGVTGWIDAGSQGADHIAEIVAVARSSPQQGRVLINIGRAGILPEGDTMDLARADVAAGTRRDREASRLRRRCKGAAVARGRGRQRLRSAAPLAGSGLVVQPAGDDPHGSDDLADRQAGGPPEARRHRDALFAPPPNAIVDDSGHILPEVLAARRRGVWFDIGNGQTGHMRWDTIGAIMKAGFWPDTFSTDWNANSKTTGVIDLPNCMSKLLGYGMTVSEAIACATRQPVAHVPGVQRPRHAQRRRAGRRGDARTARGNVRVPRQLQGHDHGTTAVLPGGTVLAGKRIATA